MQWTVRQSLAAALTLDIACRALPRLLIRSDMRLTPRERALSAHYPRQFRMFGPACGDAWPIR